MAALQVMAPNGAYMIERVVLAVLSRTEALAASFLCNGLHRLFVIHGLRRGSWL